MESAAVVSLRPIDYGNLREVLALRVTPNQERFVAPVERSLAEAYIGRDHLLVRIIYADETPVGFLMLSDVDTPPDGYFLWRFLIDQRYQGRGYGRAAIAQIAEYVRKRPNGSSLGVAYVKGDEGPEAFYRACGFVPTGRSEEGQFEARLALDG